MKTRTKEKTNRINVMKTKRILQMNMKKMKINRRI